MFLVFRWESRVPCWGLAEVSTFIGYPAALIDLENQALFPSLDPENVSVHVYWEKGGESKGQRPADPVGAEWPRAAALESEGTHWQWLPGCVFCFEIYSSALTLLVHYDFLIFILVLCCNSSLKDESCRRLIWCLLKLCKIYSFFSSSLNLVYLFP